MKSISYVGYAAASVAFTVMVGASGARLARWTLATPILSFLACTKAFLSNSMLRPLNFHFLRRFGLLGPLDEPPDEAVDELVGSVTRAGATSARIALI